MTSVDINKYLSETEDVNHTMVFVLKRWLLNYSCLLSEDTIIIQRTFELIDRVNHKLVVNRNYLLLCGIVCLDIVTNLFSQFSYEVNDFLNECNGTYNSEEFEDMAKIILHNIRLEFDSIDLFHPYEPGKHLTFKRKFLNPGCYFIPHVAIKIKAIMTLNTTEYSLKDISYVCENILSQEWSEGFPKKLYGKIMYKKESDELWPESYNLTVKKIQESFKQKLSGHTTYNYNPPNIFDDEHTLFYFESLEHTNYEKGKGSIATIFSADSDSVVKKYEPGESRCFSKHFLTELRCYQVIKSDQVVKYLGASLNKIQIKD